MFYTMENQTNQNGVMMGYLLEAFTSHPWTQLDPTGDKTLVSMANNVLIFIDILVQNDAYQLPKSTKSTIIYKPPKLMEKPAGKKGERLQSFAEFSGVSVCFFFMQVVLLLTSCRSMVMNF